MCFGCGDSHKLQACKDTTKATKSKIWKEINTRTRDWGYSPESVEVKDAVVNMAVVPAAPSSTASSAVSTDTKANDPHSVQAYAGYL